MKKRLSLAMSIATLLCISSRSGIGAQIGTNSTEAGVSPNRAAAIASARQAKLMQLLKQKEKVGATLGGVVPQAVGGGPARHGIFQDFDPPGSTSTVAVAINQEGVITGHYSDPKGTHGFLRLPLGEIQSIDAAADATITSPSAINDIGEITGFFCQPNACHGFVRNPSGKYMVFNVPGDINGTNPTGIALNGTVTGIYYDVNLVIHGFTRSPAGKITTFDVPRSGTDLFEGTVAAASNSTGTISGCYVDSNGTSHGFIRDPTGAITTFDSPGPLFFYCGNGFVGFTSGFGINQSGDSTGNYFHHVAGNAFGGNYRGYVRYPDGSFTGFDAVASPSTPCCTWTFGMAVNSEGAVTGFDNDYHSINHGFLRTTDGRVMLLDAPGAGTKFNQGTVPAAINDNWWITGTFIDAAGANHAFLWTP